MIRVLVAAAAATLLAASAAWGQDVDIQVRLAMEGVLGGTVKTQPVIQADTEVGTIDQPGYLNSNADIPYVPPGRWLCVTDFTHFAYAFGASNWNKTGAVEVQWCHARIGHSYHCLRRPGDISLVTPMAFPPGEPVQLRVNNRAERDVVVGVRLAGYLGRDASAGRGEACR